MKAHCGIEATPSILDGDKVRQLEQRRLTQTKSQRIRKVWIIDGRGRSCAVGKSEDITFQERVVITVPPPCDVVDLLLAYACCGDFGQRI